jgi:hypothetical protein
MEVRIKNTIVSKPNKPNSIFFLNVYMLRKIDSTTRLDDTYIQIFLKKLGHEKN